jgi:multiple sugar transport system substrate-binding protein
MPEQAGPGAMFSRRSFLHGGLLAAGAVGLGAATAACGTAVGQGFAGGSVPGDTIDYWNLFSGGDGTRMAQMVSDYQADHPAVRINPVTLTWGDPYYTKLALATEGGHPPQVAVAHLSRLPGLAEAGLLRELGADELARHGIAPASFDPRALEKSHVGGRWYALPLDIHPFVLFYRTDFAARAGLLDAHGRPVGLDGVDGFLAAMRAAKRATGAYAASIGINGDTSSGWRFFSTLYGQLGGQMLAEDGRRVVFDDGRAEQALEVMRQLCVDQLVPTGIDYQGAIALFAAGRAAFHFNGEWEVTSFQKSGTPFDMARFPQLFPGAYAVNADSHALVLPRQSEDDPAHRELALDLCRGLLDATLTWAKGGHIPAWLPVRTSAAYRALKPQSNYADAAEGAYYNPTAWYTGSGSSFEQVLGDAVDQVLAGRATPGAAVATMRAGLDRMASTPSPL